MSREVASSVSIFRSGETQQDSAKLLEDVFDAVLNAAVPFQIKEITVRECQVCRENYVEGQVSAIMSVHLSAGTGTGNLQDLVGKMQEIETLER